jgi:hypothetical protein
MSADLHQYLVDVGARWLCRKGFGVVATEIAVAGVTEQPDVIGFRAQCSAVLEAKASRADFLADRKKAHREAGGLGTYRLFVSSHGLILPEDLPPRWGLLWARRRGLQMVVGPTGNWWPTHGMPTAAQSQWAAFWHPSDPNAERRTEGLVFDRQASAILEIGSEAFGSCRHGSHRQLPGHRALVTDASLKRIPRSLACCQRIK